MADKKANKEISPDALISDGSIDQSMLVADEGAVISDEGLVVGDEGAAISDKGPTISAEELAALTENIPIINQSPVASAPVASSVENEQAAPRPGAMTVVEGGTGSVMSARFASLAEPAAPQSQGSMDMLLDVNLHLSVELGRTSMPVREVLHLGPGSIVELDKLAGEPVDIMVNGKLVARGEVVVIDENFGVRVTEIASPSERLSKVI